MSVRTGDIKPLLVSPYFSPQAGGSCVVYEQLCRYLSPRMSALTGAAGRQAEEWDAKQTYRIFRSCFLAPPRLGPRRGPAGRVIRGLEAHVWKRCGALAATLNAARKTGANVACIGSCGALYWLPRLVQRYAGVPAILYVHGEELTAPTGSRLIGRRHLDAMPKADGVVAVSRYTAGKLIELGVPAERVCYIPNGVDLDRFTPGEKDARLLDRYGLRGKRVLLTVGRLEERKGHATALRALPEILRRCPDVMYVVAGSGAGLPDLGLEKLASELGVADRVIFAGGVPQEELCGLYRTCDVFVMPNMMLPNGDTEGFGLVFLEAAACGKPSIGGRDGGVPDAVVDGETGLLVDGNSVEEFAEAAVRVLEDGELAGRLSRNGLARARTMTWKAAARAFEEFCGEIVQRRRRAAGG